MKVGFSILAKVDLFDIEAAIAEANPARAATFTTEIRKKCLGLAEMPHAFQIVPGYEAQELRRRVHGSYLIFYRIVGDTIEILRILHGARDYESLLGGTTPDEPG
jgi:toxin ParE1/3/4